MSFELRLFFLYVIMILAGCGPVESEEPKVQAELTASSGNPCMPGEDDATILTTLRKRMGCDFKDTPLDDVEKYFQKQLKIPFRIDWIAVEHEGIPRDCPINLRFEDTPAVVILRRFCRDMSLRFLVLNNGILITTPECNDTHRTGVYDIQDLLSPAKNSRYAGQHQELLRNDLLSVIRSTTGVPTPGWLEDGGSGNARIVGNLLIVQQSCGVHEELEQLLGKFRKLAETYRKDPQGIVTDAIETEPTTIYTHIRQVLEQKVDKIAFKDDPLVRVAERLAKIYSIPVVIDEKSLALAGIKTTTPVSFQIENTLLRTGLSQLLSKLSLMFVLRDDAVLITTGESEHDYLGKIYPMRDLLREIAKQHDNPERELEKIITATVANPKPGWVEDGGIGTIQFLGIADALIIFQTPDSHEQLVELLATLRKRFAKREANKRVDETADPILIVREYVFVDENDKDPAKAVQELAALLQRHVQPDSWKDPGVSILPVGNELVIRHRPQVIWEIERFLTGLKTLNGKLRRTPQRDVKTP